MTTYDELFPSKYMKAADLPAPRQVTIQTVLVEDFKDPKEGTTTQKGVIHFQERGEGVKPLILNKTNFKTISKTYGKNTAGWGGMRLICFATVVDAFGEQMDAVRVRIPEPVGKAAEASTAESATFPGS